MTILGCRPVDNGAVAANTGDVQLQLAGDALLVVDDPQRLFSADFDFGDLEKLYLNISNNYREFRYNLIVESFNVNFLPSP